MRGFWPRLSAISPSLNSPVSSLRSGLSAGTLDFILKEVVEECLGILSAGIDFVVEGLDLACEAVFFQSGACFQEAFDVGFTDFFGFGKELGMDELLFVQVAVEDFGRVVGKSGS